MSDAYTVQEPAKIKAREGVVFCMRIEYYTNENLLGQYSVGTHMMRIKCPSCTMRNKSKVKEWDMPVSKGYTNPWNHFQSCVGDAAVVRQAFITSKRELEAKKREEEAGDDDDDDDSKPKAQSILDNPDYGFVPNGEVQSIHNWIQLITLKNMPISDVDCKIMQETVKYANVKSSKTVMDTVHRLVRIVEDKISKQMARSSKGQLLFDGYTVGGQHYVGLFASFMEPYKGKKKGVEVEMCRHQLRLLAVAPLPAIEVEDNSSGDDDNEESETFNAKAHINFFKVTLDLYGLDFSNWVVCHCADSASVNIKIAKDTHEAHISCGSHNLGLAGAKMIDEDEDLKRILEKVHAVSSHVRNSCVVSTALRNAAAAENPQHTNVTAKGESVTRRWLGCANTLVSHMKLAGYYKKLSERKVGKMRDHKESVDDDFLDEIHEHLKYMGDIQKTSKTLQSHGMPLHETQGRLDHLRGLVEQQKGMDGKKFEKCNLELRYLKPENNLNTKPLFITGVMKIQKGVKFEQSMTVEEKNACKSLLKVGAGAEEPQCDDEEVEESFEQSYKKAKLEEFDRVMGESKYINCNFILGSAAVVESLWSEEDALMSKRRQGMNPITNEAILFLKKNKDLWKVKDVNQANEDRKAEKRDERLAKKLKDQEELAAMLAGATTTDAD